MALSEGELDSDKAEEAIAAIEVLARALGKGSGPDALRGTVDGAREASRIA